jgi:plastocyanin
MHAGLLLIWLSKYIVIVLILLAAPLTSCGGEGSSPPADAPAPTATRTRNATPGPTATPQPTQELTLEAAPEPTPQPPLALTIVARDMAFDGQTIAVPANVIVTVTLQNNDVDIAHDFGVSLLDVPHTETCFGPCEGSITFVAPRGTYSFHCSVHAEMVGTLIAE